MSNAEVTLILPQFTLLRKDELLALFTRLVSCHTYKFCITVLNSCDKLKVIFVVIYCCGCFHLRGTLLDAEWVKCRSNVKYNMSVY